MKATRASYAASFSISQIPKEHESFVKSQINKLNYISVRENSGLKILYNLGIKKGYMSLILFSPIIKSMDATCYFTYL